MKPLRPYSESEMAILKKITKPDVTVEVIVPKEIDAEKFWEVLSITCQAYMKAEAQTSVLFPLLGRLLLVAKQNPESYKAKFETYEELIAAVGEKFGVGRTTCFEARRLADKWGPAELEMHTYADIGRVKFKFLGSIVPSDAVSQGWVKGLLKKAGELTLKELREYCEDKGYAEKGSTGASIIMACSKRMLKDWRKFCKTPEVQAYCGTDDPAEILDHLMQECESEWLSAGAEKVKEAAKVAKQEEKAAKADAAD
jgi:hypothetical protein